MSDRSHKPLVGKLVLLAVGMFAFGFVVMPPLYTLICDVTGLGGKGIKIRESVSSEIPSDRQVKIRFDATTNSELPWMFEAKDKSSTVTLGEMSEALYLAMNTTEQALVGHAIYNVTPPEASLYFVKTECFCFTRQTLQAHETREMPVYYFIQPNLPEYIKEITLSYTFYPDTTEDAVAVQQPADERPGT